MTRVTNPLWIMTGGRSSCMDYMFIWTSCFDFFSLATGTALQWYVIAVTTPKPHLRSRHPSVIKYNKACRIEFWPHWISTRGVLIQRAVLRIQRIFHVELRPQRQGVIELRPLRRIKFGPPVELWTRVFIPRWIMTLGINSTLNFDPESWFNVKLWPGIGITI